jgi:hypothetical protein
MALVTRSIMLSMDSSGKKCIGGLKWTVILVLRFLKRKPFLSKALLKPLMTTGNDNRLMVFDQMCRSFSYRGVRFGSTLREAHHPAVLRPIPIRSWAELSSWRATFSPFARHDLSMVIAPPMLNNRGKIPPFMVSDAAT